MNKKSLKMSSPSAQTLSCVTSASARRLSVHRTNLPHFRFYRNSPRPCSRVKVNERRAGPQQMSCVENNTLLFADGLSVAKETVPTVIDIGPVMVLMPRPAGSPLGRPVSPGPLAARVGSLNPESEGRVSGHSHSLLM